MDDDWPPPAARARASLWRAERHFLAGEYAAAGDSLRAAVACGSPGTAAVARGLLQLAAAGYRGQAGDPVRAARLLDHARTRLAPFLPRYEEVELGVLLEVVAASLEP